MLAHVCRPLRGLGRIRRLGSQGLRALGALTPWATLCRPP